MIIYIFSRIKTTIEYTLQKIFRRNHISDNEIWECYHFLAKLILPRLIAFRNLNKMGFALVSDEYPNEHYNYEQDGQTELWEDRWEKTVDEMIYAFEHILYYDDDRKQKFFLDKYFGGKLYEKEEAEKRVQEGLRLFGKYFRDLWD
jgi:hypothetical protein